MMVVGWRWGEQAGTPFHLKLLLEERSWVGSQIRQHYYVPIAKSSVGRRKRLHYGSPEVVGVIVIPQQQ